MVVRKWCRSLSIQQLAEKDEANPIYLINMKRQLTNELNNGWKPNLVLKQVLNIVSVIRYSTEKYIANPPPCFIDFKYKNMCIFLLNKIKMSVACDIRAHIMYRASGQLLNASAAAWRQRAGCFFGAPGCAPCHKTGYFPASQPFVSCPRAELYARASAFRTRTNSALTSRPWSA